MDVEFRQVTYKSFDYGLLVKLRDEELRKPIQLSIYDDPLDQEFDHIHIGCFYMDQAVGVAILSPCSKTRVKLRQVAISKDYQGLGLGKKLVLFCEGMAKSRGFLEIELHGRGNALQFYEKLDYHLSGEPFLEVGLLHQKMLKKI